MMVYRLRGTMAWREVEGEIVALDELTSSYVNINGPGAELWKSLMQGATMEQLVAQLQETYGIDAETAHRDVHAFIESLLELDLLVA